MSNVALKSWRLSGGAMVSSPPATVAGPRGPFEFTPLVSVVVPARNEARNLPHVLPRIPHWVHEVVLIDGASSDRTVEVARRVRPGIRIIQQDGHGKGNALRAGFRAVTGDVIVTLDADGSADPAEITAFVGVLLSGADFVKGSRFLQGGGTADMELHRRLGNSALRLAARLAFGGRFTDLCYGYNAFWAEVLPRIEPDVDGFEIETLMNIRALRSSLTVAEVPSFEARRIHGSSNLRPLADGWRVLKTIAQERLRDRPRPLAGPPGTPAIAPPNPFSVANRPLVESPSRDTARTVSVVVCAYTERRWEDLVAGIDSLERQTSPVHEVIVVVDHNDDLLVRVRRERPRPLSVPNAHGRGLSGARNTGIELATGDIVAFLDDDALPPSEWVAGIAALFSDADVLGAGGSARPAWPSGAQPAWFPAEFGWVVGCSYTGQPEARSPVRNLLGCNMAFRRDVLDAIGGFRPSMGRVGGDGFGCEETELCIRASEHFAGGRIVYEPGLAVGHRVTPERATWRYFCRRCYAEGRSKALVTSLVGASRGLASERAYATRVLPRGVAAGTGDLARGRPTGIVRSGAILLGLAFTTAGYTRGRLGRPSAVVASDPVRVLDLELGAPARSLPAVDPASGRRYRRARVLARVDGRPVGQVDIEVPPAGLPGPDLAAQVMERLGQVLPAPGERRPPGRRPDVPVAVVVATRDRPAQLARCLDSLLACDYPRVALIVVDNAPSSEATADLVRDRYPTVTYLREPTPGLAVAHNRGLAAVRAPIVAFTDDDVIVDRLWLASLVSVFNGDRRAACVTGLIVAAELDTAAQQWIDEHGGFGKGFERQRFQVEHSRPVDPLFPYAPGRFGSGANMAFRTDVLRSLGGFDPTLGAGTRSRGGDDLAAFVDVVAAGHALVYEPAAIVRHHHHREIDRARAQAYNYGVGLSAYLTRLVVRRPQVVLHLARHGPMAVAGLVRKRTAGARRSGSPRVLLWLEALGLARGPFAYAHARLVNHRRGATT